jgi:hypothetical protein
VELYHYSPHMTSSVDKEKIPLPFYFTKVDKSCGARGGAIGLGTALQAGRPRIRFPMVSLEFFIDVILPAHYGPGVDSASNRNKY